ncbi:MAG: hypothetical protein FJ087_22875, partial [Deltaproteobacteria bacterium]|nr:hypothetical protein [Deltaproteobacteria bacterium]
PSQCSSSGDCCPDYQACCNRTCSCSGKQCGDDGCGNSCGTCASGKTCNASGQCVTSSAGCGSITGVGCCAGTVNWWCANVGGTKALQNEDCGPSGCGWDQYQNPAGYYCGKTGSDPSGTYPKACPPM